jgi:two-component system response regulator GlrR
MICLSPQPIVPRMIPTKESYILLVDDHEPSLRRLDELLKISGYASVPACSGTEALLCCDLRPPRLVVTDLAMPNLDGLALARWLRSRHPSVPIILLSGQAFDSRLLDELQRTFTAVLSKPVEIDRFLALIDRLMPGRSKQGRESGRP